MKQKLKQPRVEQANQMAERERKELLEKQQAKKEKMELEKRDLRKSWAGRRKVVTFMFSLSIFVCFLFISLKSLFGYYCYYYSHFVILSLIKSIRVMHVNLVMET